MRSWLALAALAGVALTATAVAITVVGVAGSGQPTPADLLPVLVAMAALCVVGLTNRTAPSIAWLAVIGALTVATLDIAAFGRMNRGVLGPVGWQWLAAVVCLGSVVATGAAARYASEPGRRLGRWVVVAAVVGVGLVGVVCVWVLGTLEPAVPDPPDSLGILTLATRALLGAVLAFTTLGILGDLRPAVRRTRVRLGERSSPAIGLAGAVGRAADATLIFVDELAPGRGRARRAATAERSRLATELHAEVAPVVRRALLEAERGGSPERLVVALRDVLAEVDGLAADRRSVVLDELGLLPAIEWLAERTEERSDVRVTIDVAERSDEGGRGAAGAGPGDGRPPRPVEAAAFRVAQLALENVVRHAPAAAASIELTAEAGRVRLVVSDDGPGIPADAARLAVAGGRRGLADMRTEAEGCGASLATEVVPGGRGTVVRFAWPPD
jgi:signal transduction histidine kinase